MRGRSAGPGPFFLFLVLLLGFERSRTWSEGRRKGDVIQGAVGILSDSALSGSSHGAAGSGGGGEGIFFSWDGVEMWWGGCSWNGGSLTGGRRGSLGRGREQRRELDTMEEEKQDEEKGRAEGGGISCGEMEERRGWSRPWGYVGDGGGGGGEDNIAKHSTPLNHR